MNAVTDPAEQPFRPPRCRSYRDSWPRSGLGTILGVIVPLGLAVAVLGLPTAQFRPGGRRVAQQKIDLGVERDKSHWPPGVRPLGLAELDLIGGDGKGGLYWDGKPIEVRKRLDLTRGERLFALIVGLFTIAGSVGAVAQGWAAAHQWSCMTGLVTARCPVISNTSAPAVPGPQKSDR